MSGNREEPRWEYLLDLRGRLYQRVPYFQGARTLEIANDVYGEVVIAPMPMSVLLFIQF